MKNICGLSSRVVANQERVILVRVRYIDSSSMEITEIEQQLIREPDHPLVWGNIIWSFFTVSFRSIFNKYKFRITWFLLFNRGHLSLWAFEVALELSIEKSLVFTM